MMRTMQMKILLTSRAMRLLCLLLLVPAVCSACAKPGPLVGKWQEESGMTTEFRADGTVVGADGTESKWQTIPSADPSEGTLTLMYGDIAMEFHYSIAADQLTLQPLSLAGEQDLQEQVALPTVMTRVKD
jgi:hypothetical protein